MFDKQLHSEGYFVCRNGTSLFLLSIIRYFYSKKGNNVSCPTQALFLILGLTTMPREIENKAFAKFGKEARGKQRAYSQIVILELLVMLVEEIVIKLLLTPKIA